MSGCVRNIRTKNYQNQIIGFQVTAKNVEDVFFGTQCITYSSATNKWKRSNQWMKQATVLIADNNRVESSECSRAATDFNAPCLNKASLCSTVSDSILQKQLTGSAQCISSVTDRFHHSHFLFWIAIKMYLQKLSYARIPLNISHIYLTIGLFHIYLMLKSSSQGSLQKC